MNSRFTPPTTGTEALCALLTMTVTEKNIDQTCLLRGLANLPDDESRIEGVGLLTNTPTTQIREFLDFVQAKPEAASCLIAFATAAAETRAIAPWNEAMPLDGLMQRMVQLLTEVLGEDEARFGLQKRAEMGGREGTNND